MSDDRKEIKFVCPQCKGTKLESFERVEVYYPIKTVYDDGDVDYDITNKREADGEVEAIQCAECGFQLGGWLGPDEITEWLREHCPQD